MRNAEYIDIYRHLFSKNNDTGNAVTMQAWWRFFYGKHGEYTIKLLKYPIYNLNGKSLCGKLITFKS